MKYLKNILILSSILWLLIFIPSCGHNEQNEKKKMIAEGESLAKTYCITCHNFPSPDLLNKQTWRNNVLPVMANFMNLHYVGDSVLLLPKSMVEIDSSILPFKTNIAVKDFRKIEAFYISKAPNTLPLQKRPEPISTSFNQFSIVPLNNNQIPPFTTAIAIDSKHHLIYQADAAQRAVNIFDNHLQFINQIKTNNICTSFKIIKDNLYATNIGEFKPNPGKLTGNIIVYGNALKYKLANPKILLDSLDRSVESIEVDLDNDGKKDLIVCEFGFLRGNFSWYKNVEKGKYVKKTLKAVPGAISVYVEDVNHDGLTDIWVLFGQAREGISLFINKGNGVFEEHVILTFPPVYGSSSFELVDMNHDGKEDIIYTCGDNNDYSQILKPYHGVYIFINQGNYIFKQEYFFPINGCYKAMARDFENNGKLDLACISYFADYDHQPQESFVYLKNEGNLKFKPFSIPNIGMGRWICMNVNDLNGDGKLDIILGNCAAPYQNRQDWLSGWMKSPAFVLLQSKLK